MRCPHLPGRVPPAGPGLRRRARGLGTLSLGVGLGLGLALPASPQGPALVSGLRLEERLAGGASRRYPVELKAGDLLRAIVTEDGIDVVVRLLGPDGATVAYVDGPRDPKEDEDLAAIAPRDGAYQLEVRSDEPGKPAGRYTLRIADLRPADERDRRRAEAVAASQRAVEAMRRQDATGWRRQLDLRERALGLWQALDERGRVAETELQMGMLRRKLGEGEAAAGLLHRAIDDFRAADDRAGLAEALAEAGGADRGPARRAEAVEHFQEALPLARAGADRRLEARLLNDLGSGYIDLGRPRDALAPLGRAREIAHELGDPIETRVLNSLGAAYADLGERQIALAHYREALAVAERTGRLSDEANAWNSLGETHEVLGVWEKASKEHYQALDLVQKTGDRSTEARVWNNLAVVARRRGRYREATKAFASARRLGRDLGDGEIQAIASANLAFLELDRRRPARAKAAAEAALAVAPKDGEGEADAWHALGAARQATGDLPGAAAALARALDMSRARGDLTSEVSVTYFLARTARAGGDLARADELAGRALEILESVRSRVASSDLRASFFASRQSYYELAVDTLMTRERAAPKKGFAAQALAVAERARARSLLETLAAAGAEPLAPASRELAARERRVSAADFHLSELVHRAAPAAEIAAAERDRDAAVATFDQAEAELADESPSRATGGEPQPLSAGEIERQVVDRDTVLLEFALGEQRSYLWAVTDTATTGYELPPRAAIEAAAKLFYDLLTARTRTPAGETPEARHARIARADRELPAAGRALSRLILAPAAGRLGRRRLAVVADGLLQYVPFVALPDPRAASPDAPLVATHEVVILPSASALAVLRGEIAGRAPAPRLLAVLADPVLSRDDERVENRTAPAPATLAGRRRGPQRPRSAGHPERSAPPARRGGAETFPRLRFSSEEADSITALAPRRDFLVKKGFEASRSTALSGELAKFRIVHFATHGSIDSEHPALSSLVLSLVDRRGRPQDGFLRLSDVYGLELHADLVVLSACRTALGKEVRGEGLIGLTRGFMYAGAARVLASRGSAADHATAALMRRFYRGMLVARRPPAAALRRAQLGMARDRLSPYSWAGFSLEGEWR